MSENKLLSAQSTAIATKDPIAAPPEDDSPIVGISTNSFKAGETANIMVAGTSIMPVEDASWRTHMGVYLHEAQRLGIEVPDKLLIHAGQLFWKNGKVVEARLSGYAVIGEPDDNGKAEAVGWQTPVPPHFTRGAQGELILAPEDAGRTHMSVFLTESPETPGKALMVVTLDLTENQRIADARIAKRDAQKEVAPRTATLSRVLHFTADNIHHATITAFARAADWQPGEKYFRGLEQEYKNLNIAVYLPDGEQAASLWEFLKKGGAAMVKAHYALWARYYEQVPDGLSLEYVTVNINDFCRDLGYTPHHKGGFKPEAKRQAMKLLHTLTNAEMAATYQVPGQKKGHTKTRRLKGTIWSRGMDAEERDTYDDLFGQAREGNPEQWTPVSFSFAPGPWHADKEWRRHNRFVGKIGAGLMRLDTRYDEWAILIGGYLGALARIGKYRARRLRISTILEQTGLGAAIGHRQAQFREKFYRALDRLQEEGVIKSYQTEGFDDSDVDPDDLAELAAYGQRDPYPPGDWRGWKVEIEFDFAADTSRLESAQTRAIEAKKRKSQRRRKPKTEGD